LLGANGAGKTSTLKCISGVLKAAKGKIIYKDKDITSESIENIVKAGIVQSPEGRQVFATLSVKENLMAGAFTINDPKKVQENLELAYSYFPRLKEREKQYAGTLSGGEQQMLAIARALMASPELLILDEPSLGLAPLIVKDIFRIVKEINKTGTTILLVEQNAKQALEVSDYAYVLETGKILFEGPASEMQNNDDIKKAYLGA
jgi:branched-chain amino acid transport system ATP-binding protein